MARWREIIVRVPHAEADVATAQLASLGFAGTELRESDRFAELVVHVECTGDNDAAAAAAAIGRVMPTARVEIGTEIDEQVWATNWQAFFPRMRIGERLELLPPWESTADVEAPRVPIVINPANAFGTGHHETTSSCLELLDKLVGPGQTVADIGCGTGVLAIAALLLGAEQAVGIDNDEDAVNAAHENAVLNQIADRLTLLLGEGPEPTKSLRVFPYDLVIANIFAEKLIEMSRALTSCVKRGGTLVLSGIESSRAPLVVESFSELGWQPIERLTRGEWVTLALQSAS